MKKTNKISIITVLFMVAIPSLTPAEIAYNKQNRQFYSIGAEKKVNQNEYHNLVISMLKIVHFDKANGVNFIEKKIKKLLKNTKTAASKRILYEFENNQATLLTNLYYELTLDELFHLSQEVGIQI